MFLLGSSIIGNKKKYHEKETYLKYKMVNLKDFKRILRTPISGKSIPQVYQDIIIFVSRFKDGHDSCATFFNLEISKFSF